jgi:hypothetical protein
MGPQITGVDPRSQIISFAEGLLIKQILLIGE